MKNDALQSLHRILLDPLANTSKPTEGIKAINNRLVKNETSLTTKELSNVISNGQTFVPATFKGHARKNENWEQQSILALDFDSGSYPEDVLSRLKEFKIDHSFFYTTFSDSPSKRKFRVVFELEKPLIVVSHAKWAVKLLMAIFPEADKACKDPARLFFGGLEILFENFKPLNLDRVVSAAETLTASKSSIANRGKALDGLYPKMDEFGADSYTIYKDPSKIHPKLTTIHEYDNEPIKYLEV